MKSIWAATPIVLVYWASGIALNYSNASFLHAAPFPSLLVAFQMGVSAVLVQPAKCLAPDAPGTSPDAVGILLRVVPASLLLTASMVFENMAHSALSVGVFHLVVCANPAVMYLMSCCAGIDDFAVPKLQALVIIFIGAAVAGGSISGATPMGLLLGIISQLGDCGNVLLLAVLLSVNGLRLDPFKVMSYYAAVSALCLVAVGFTMEWPEDVSAAQAKFLEEVGFGALLLNAANAFVMQLSILILIYRTDPVTAMVFSLIRGMVMDAFGALAFGQPVTIEELIGDLFAVVGVQVFNLVRPNPEDFGSLSLLLGGLLRSAQGLVFEVSTAQQNPAAKAKANKKAFNTVLDDELDLELHPVVQMVGARPSPAKRDSTSEALSMMGSTRTEFFQIGDRNDMQGSHGPQPEVFL